MRDIDSGERRPGGEEPAGTSRADLSVVIPCLDVARVLDRQLLALSEQAWDGNWEVIIADNGSTDATRAVANSFGDRLPGIRVVDASERRGRQHACNEGARAAGRAVAFVDADDEVAPGYVAALGDSLAAHSIVAASIDHATLNDGWTREGSSDVQTASLQNGHGFLPFGSGGTLAMRSDVFSALGGFAGDMDYAEDIDFCWRAQLAGYDIAFVPEAVLQYRYRPSLRSMYRQHRNFGRGAALLFRTYRTRGMPRRDLNEWSHEWMAVAKSMLFIRSRAGAARWVRRFGRNIGRLQGSVRYRVWFP